MAQVMVGYLLSHPARTLDEAVAILTAEFHAEPPADIRAAAGRYIDALPEATPEAPNPSMHDTMMSFLRSRNPVDLVAARKELDGPFTTEPETVRQDAIAYYFAERVRNGEAKP